MPPLFSTTAVCLWSAGSTMNSERSRPRRYTTRTPVSGPKWRRMIEARSFPTASVLDDGRVLVAGGSHTGVGPTAMRRTAEIYDPTRNIWKPAGQFAVSRAGHTATILSDGRVLVVGGAGSASTIALAEVYDPVSNDWSPAGSLTLSRTNHSASTMSDGRVIVAGGWGDNGSAGHLVELFDPRVGTWLTLAASQ